MIDFVKKSSYYGHKKEKYIMRERVDVGERLMNKGIEAS